MLIPLYDENPTRRFPLITTLLIAANALVFFWESTLSQGLLHQAFVLYGFIPSKVYPLLSEGRVLDPTNATIISSMFLHANFLHFAGNMLYLWIFGNNIEDRIGRTWFFVFYMACGIGAGIAQIVSAPLSQVPGIGASGAVAGSLGAYLRLFPRARVVAVIPIFFFLQVVKVSAFFMLGMWIAFQSLSGFMAASGPQGSGGVAWFAHIGGFFLGFLLINFFPSTWRKD